MRKKTLFYLLLFVGLLLGLIGFFSFLGQPALRKLVVIITSLFYFSWGMVYHYQEKTLHPKIVIEYLLIAVLGAMLLMSISW